MPLYMCYIKAAFVINYATFLFNNTHWISINFLSSVDMII